MQDVKVYYMPNSNDSFIKECDVDKAIKAEKDRVINELINKMKDRYLHKIGVQFDNAIYEMEKIANEIK